MQAKALSIRPFIGSKDFHTSRDFYRDLGFAETELSSDMSVFKKDALAFYLQDTYVKDWIDNTMVFVEVDDVEQCRKEVLASKVTEKYEGVRLSLVKEEEWGSEFFLHDPAGVLWHFGAFK